MGRSIVLRRDGRATAVLVVVFALIATCAPSVVRAEFIRLLPTYAYGPSSPFANGTYPEFETGLQAVNAAKADYQSVLDSSQGVDYRVEWGSTVTSPDPQCRWSPASINDKPEAFCAPMTLYRKNTPNGPWEFQVSATFSATLRLKCPSGFSRSGRALTTDASGYAIAAEEWCEGFASMAPYIKPNLPIDEALSCRVPAASQDASQDGLATPNPIVPATGDKVRRETDYAEALAHGLSFTRTYVSSRAKAGEADSSLASPMASSLGRGWRHNHSASIAVSPMTSSEPELATVTLGDGNMRRFRRNDSFTGWVALSGADRLTIDPQGASTFADASDDRQYSFSASGLLQTVRERTALLTWNAQDDIVQASDFKGVATRYARDAQGNATAEASPDIGSIRTQYDALGLPASIVDAMGQATNITRDLLGRPTVITFADGKTTTLRYDLTASSKGYLSEITDRSGTTQYTRDAFGRVVLKRQILASGLTQQVGYAYAANGLLSAISYPNGKVLGYRYDATGRLTQIDVDGQPVLASLAWNPMGQPTGWNWAFASTALNATRQYDTAGQLVATEFSKYIYDAAGRITNVAQDLIRPSDADPTHSTLTGYVGIWNVAYDPVGRITGFNSNTDKNAFGYDANGNRTSSTRTVNGQTTTRTYAVEGPSNRLLGFGQTQGATSTNVAYGYNANGDLTSDGLKSFSYNAEGRLSAVTTGATDTSPTTRYAHNALGQRVFKTEPLFPPAPGDEANPSFMQSLIAFFTKMWAPSSTDAEKLGFAFMYDEEGNLLSETGTGGANSTGSTMHIYLPTATGAMPVAAIVNGQMFAVHSDHLNTPRKITNAAGQVVWQWAYSAFGEDEPTIAAKRFTSANTTPTNGATSISPITYNLRYWGMQGDTQSGLFYNGFRSYKPGVGYTQNDPIGLASGLNRKTALENNPLVFTDPLGLWSVDVGVFLGNGINFSFGRDPDSSRSFFSTQFGKGIGGGFTFAPTGGMPAGIQGLLDCGNEQVFVGAFGKAGVSGFGANLDIASADAGVSLPSKRPYSGTSALDVSFGKKWGLKADISGGVQFTTISAGRVPGSCTCQFGGQQR